MKRKLTKFFQKKGRSKLTILCYVLFFQSTLNAQVISKPVGCFAGTNGTNSAVLSHSESRGVLLIEKWKDIELSPGVFDFTALDNKINTVTSAGLKYSLAIAGGSFGSPDWLMDSLGSSYLTFQYQNENWRLPLWWDTICEYRLNALIEELGIQYASDSLLSHVYITQMTTNGIEGHLNGVDMSSFATAGYTDQKWITSAEVAIFAFSEAFPDKPIVFEVHEINNDTIVPATIINNAYSDPIFCERFGLGMWWISGKTTYQEDLIAYISSFQGDKYAQVIGRSDQPERFRDSLYSTVFTQAKDLGVRYIEPWPYEFQFNTHDSLFHDFNLWADANFSQSDTCAMLSVNNEIEKVEIQVFPNPTKGIIHILPQSHWENFKVSIFNQIGQKLLITTNQTEIDISNIPNGLLVVTIEVDGIIYTCKVLKNNY